MKNLLLKHRWGAVILAAIIAIIAGTVGDFQRSDIDLDDVTFVGARFKDTDSTQDGWLSVKGDSGSTTAGNSTGVLTIAGGSGVTTSVAGDTVTVAGDDADDDGTTKGVATFNNDDFDAASGVVTLADTSWPIALTAGGATISSANAPAQTQIEGTNFPYFVLEFDADADETANWNNFSIPLQYTGGTITAKIKWVAAATSGNVTWNLQVLSVGDSGAYDQALGAAQSVTTTTDGVAGDINESTITAFDPSWTAGDILSIGLTRDADHATDDTMTGDARVLETNILWPSTR